MKIIKNSRVVYVRLKKSKAQLGRIGKNSTEEQIYNKKYVGSCLTQGGAPLSGLTLEEEIQYLPEILSMSPDDKGWNKQVKDYWANVRRQIPIDDVGLPLEVGFYYKSEEDYNKGIKEENEELRRIVGKTGRDAIEKFTVRNKVGTPLNVDDFIFWRYALVYPRIANSYESSNSSPKIEFYLYSKERLISEQKVSFDLRQKAVIKFYEILADVNKKNAIAKLMRSDILNYNYGKVDAEKLHIDNPVLIDIALETLAKEVPERFIAVVDDKHLMQRAFIEKAIDLGELYRVPNTTVIMYDGEQIGNDVISAVNYLKAEANRETFNIIKARLKEKTTDGIVETAEVTGGTSEVPVVDPV